MEVACTCVDTSNHAAAGASNKGSLPLLRLSPRIYVVISTCIRKMPLDDKVSARDRRTHVLLKVISSVNAILAGL